jgi:hypothetical protein
MIIIIVAVLVLLPGGMTAVLFSFTAHDTILFELLAVRVLLGGPLVLNSSSPHHRRTPSNQAHLNP